MKESILAADPEVAVEVVMPEERGYGVTLHEVLRIWTEVKESENAIFQTVVGVKLAVEWMRKRWQKDSDDHPGQRPRPRSVLIYGPNGEPLERVQIDLPAGQPIPGPPEDDQPLVPRSSS